MHEDRQLINKLASQERGRESYGYKAHSSARLALAREQCMLCVANLASMNSQHGMQWLTEALLVGMNLLVSKQKMLPQSVKFTDHCR